jgi:hypothetical protein
MARRIELSRGYMALVDDEDYDALAQHKWAATDAGRNGRVLLYATRAADRHRRIAMHRQIMGVVDAGPEVQVDHKDGDGLNNQRENLRVTDNKANAENRQRLNRNNTSGARGVSIHPPTGRWHVRVGHHGRRVHGGFFDNLEDAVRAAEALRQRLYTPLEKELADE